LKISDIFLFESATRGESFGTGAVSILDIFYQTRICLVALTTITIFVLYLYIRTQFFRIEDGLELEDVPALDKRPTLIEFNSDFGLFFFLDLFETMPETFDGLLVGLFIDCQHRKRHWFGLARPPIHFDRISMHNFSFRSTQG
jgi:hypothetical protein